MKHRLIALAALAVTISMAQAAGLQASVSDPWVRALPGDLPAGGYFTLHNNSDATLTLTAAKSDACGMLMLHKSETASGMAQMENTASIDVPAHGALSFAPGGYHLMCMAPKSALKPGKTIKIELQFAGGQSLKVAFPVRNASGH